LPERIYGAARIRFMPWCGLPAAWRIGHKRNTQPLWIRLKCSIPTGCTAITKVKNVVRKVNGMQKLLDIQSIF
jgi:hypothetical protein